MAINTGDYVLLTRTADGVKTLREVHGRIVENDYAYGAKCAGDGVETVVFCTPMERKNQRGVLGLAVETSTPIVFSDTRISWDFTDNGFIAGGQAGAYRAYSDPDNVSASPWGYRNQGLGLRLDWEHDNNCGTPYNPNTQSATAVATIIVPEDITVEMTVDWDGIGEEEATGFDVMSLVVDGSLVATANAPGGGLGCSFGPVTSTPASPQTVSLASGEHSLNISASTNDALYHVGCWYQFDLTFDPPIF
jgi:hypothetical protein